MVQRWFWRLLGVYVLIVALHATPAQATATTDSAWFGATEPTAIVLSPPGTSETPPYRISGNRDCEKRQLLVFRPLAWSFVWQELSQQGCVVDTNFGAVNTSSTLLQRPGTSISGPLNAGSSTVGALWPISRSDNAMVSGGSAVYGNYMRFYLNISQHISTTTRTSREIFHTLEKDTPQADLTDRLGNRIAVHQDSLSFSANGNWLLIDAPSIGMLRVDTQTLEVLPFGGAVNYGIGLSPSYQTAISADGRFAAVSSYTFGVFRLYDLSTCEQVPDRITKGVNCDSKDLHKLMPRLFTGYQGASHLRFLSNNALELYVSTKNNNTNLRQHAVVLAAGEALNGTDYLALGDSFASGEGAFNYKASTDMPLNKCHLSLSSYPYLLAARIGMHRAESVACSGAVIYDVSSTGDYLEPQAKGKAAASFDGQITANYEPGYRPQITFVEKYRPKVITLSVVGNDIGFGDIINACVNVSTCFESYQDRLSLMLTIDGKFDELSSAYTTLRQAGDPSARMYVIGYPKIAKEGGNCAVNVGLNAAEVVFARQMTEYLNNMIKRAAQKAGVFYVDVANAFEGHRLCEIESSQAAVNGLTAGNDIVSFLFIHGPIGLESYHPNARGHELLSRTILEQTADLTKPMPPPQPDLTPPVPLASDELLLTARKDPVQQAIERAYTDRAMSPDAATRGAPIEVQIDVSTSLTPGSTVKFWLHSSPLLLGSLTLDKNGGGTTTLLVPADVPPGMHVLHAYATNVAGESVDIFKTIYIAASASDADGDGIDNAIDSCISLPQSGQDLDKDGTDDACDGFIDTTSASPPVEAPAQPTTQETDAPSKQTVTSTQDNTSTRGNDLLAAQESMPKPAVLIETWSPNESAPLLDYVDLRGLNTTVAVLPRLSVVRGATEQAQTTVGRAAATPPVAVLGKNDSTISDKRLNTPQQPASRTRPDTQNRFGELLGGAAALLSLVLAMVTIRILLKSRARAY